MKAFYAPLAHQGNEGILSGVRIEVNDEGTITDFQQGTLPRPGDKQLAGMLVPGWINAHCHTELSYQHEKIPLHTGLDEFIRRVEELKLPDASHQKQSIQRALDEMERNGIRAVGDICNTAESFVPKTGSPISFFNFLEIYAFSSSRAEAAFEKGKRLAEDLLKTGTGSHYSISPHAPYSASPELLGMMDREAGKKDLPLSIHNQENEDEDLLFREKKGRILERLKHFGIDVDSWEHPRKSSLRAVLDVMAPDRKLLLVHNTFTGKEDIADALGTHSNLWWCFCPKANLYIENKLPDLNLFIGLSERICVGTDSLASNNSLDILEELKTLKKHFPSVSSEILIRAATANGAKFLGFEKETGSFEPGKKPGINLLENLNGDEISPETRLKRII